jgi:uncharacterized protein with FMN-binding domain
VITLLIAAVAIAQILRPRYLDIENVDFSVVADGTYTGVFQNKILLAVVQVEVADHKIVSIEILEHKDAYLPQARQIAGDVLNKQSLEVDAISGATLTSDTVLKAIEDALKQGIS